MGGDVYQTDSHVRIADPVADQDILQIVGEAEEAVSGHDQCALIHHFNPSCKVRLERKDSVG